MIIYNICYCWEFLIVSFSPQTLVLISKYIDKLLLTVKTIKIFQIAKLYHYYKLTINHGFQTAYMQLKMWIKPPWQLQNARKVSRGKLFCLDSIFFLLLFATFLSVFMLIFCIYCKNLSAMSEFIQCLFME